MRSPRTRRSRRRIRNHLLPPGGDPSWKCNLMRLLQWSYNGLIVPMLEDEEGHIFTTGPILRAALGMEDDALRAIASRHRHRFDWSQSVTIRHTLTEFLRHNRELFGLSYVRRDIKLWSDADMINVAFLSNSPLATSFRQGIIELVRQQARKDYVSLETFEKVTATRNGKPFTTRNFRPPSSDE